MLASALKEMMVNETITEAPKDCDDSGVFWETGKKLFHYLKSRNINGKTGRVVFTKLLSLLRNIIPLPPPHFPPHDFITPHSSKHNQSFHSFHLFSLFIFQLDTKAFDDSGDRINAEYDVINIGKKGAMKIVGSLFYDNVSHLPPFLFVKANLINLLSRFSPSFKFMLF